MKFSAAIRGFLIVRGVDLSVNTVELYSWALNLICRHLNDPEVTSITEPDLIGFFNYVQRDYIPTRMTGSVDPLKPRSVENIWVAMRSFWNWAQPELKIKHRPDKRIPRPRYEKEPIAPFTEAEVDAILKSCEYTRPSEPSQRASFQMKRPTALRDIALISVLLDTGIRASECSRLNVGDINLDTGEVKIQSWGTGRKTKPHSVMLGKAGRKAVWRYLSHRGDPPDYEPLFTTALRGSRMNRNTIRQLINDLGSRAGVKNCHPHRFRHTMAVFFLRNGGDVFTLQKILGHESLEMVHTYLKLTQCDIAIAHRRASPLDGLRR